jgi:Ca-activated chloride channel family protein
MPVESEMKMADAEEPMDEKARAPAALRQPLPYEAFGSSIYLSNDDTMSLSSAQRIIYAIDKFLPLPASHIRPHELLNYFSFDTEPVAAGYDFSVHPDIAADPRQPGVYTLALAVRGRALDKDTRRNAALTFIIDRSGSMKKDGRMTYLKQGLERAMNELKTGDIVNLTVFDHQICSPVEGFVVGRDDPAVLRRIIGEIEPRGSTDLFAGLTEGYRLADAAYQRSFNNRVLLITDALANRGETSPNLAGIVSRYYESRQIRLSGVGVGAEFNDTLLDTLTEKGKGAYVFLGGEAEVDAVFGPRFLSLIETTALDVHFRLHLPRSMKMNVFYGEESSTVKSDVQAIHYFANTSQLFLSDLLSIDGQLHPEEPFAVTIEYSDAETGMPLVEEYVFNLGQVARDSRNIRKARLLMSWVDLLSEISQMRPEGEIGVQGGQWLDGWAYGRCGQGKGDLTRLALGQETDPEVRRVMSLWDRFCSRFSPPRNPVRRVAPPSPLPDAWPSASEASR